MTLAADYPALGLFWTFLWLYLVLAWLTVLLHVVLDVFRNRELRGIVKAIWLLTILVLPLVGVVAYTIKYGVRMAMGHGPSEHDKAAALRAYTDHGMGYGHRATGYY